MSNNSSNNSKGFLGKTGLGLLEPKGTLDIYGSQYIKITSVNSSTYNLDPEDFLLHVIYSVTGSCTITIPQDQCIQGRVLNIKDAGVKSATNNITIVTGGAEKIYADTTGGQDTFIINNDGMSITLYCFEGNWYIC